MSHRNQNILSLSALSAVLLLAVLVLVNVAASHSRVRVDLTEEGLYTLADGSRRILENLQDPATIKVFWQNVPDEAAGEERDVRALLEEMETAARGRLTVRWVDLDAEEGQREAEDAGVQKRQITALREGQITATDSYADLVIEVEDDQQQLPELLNQGPQLEYEIVSRLHGMTTEPPVVGLIAPQPASNPFMGQAAGGRFRVLSERVLREQFGSSFRSAVNLDEPVPPDVKVLVVAAPESFTDTQVFHLEQYLLGGGRVLLLLDPVHATSGAPPNTEPVESGFDDWLGHLGVTVESGVVGDYRNYLMRIQRRDTARGPVGELVDYPYWPLLRYQFLDEDNPAIRNFDQVPLFWPVPLSVDEARQEAAERDAKVLATTTASGYRRPDLIGLDTPRDPVTEEDLEAIPVAVQLEGSMVSFWKGRPSPLEVAEAEAEAAAAELDDADAPEDADGEDEAESAEAEDADVEIEEEEGPPRLEEGAGLLVVLTDAELVSDTPLMIAQQLRFFGMGPAYQNGFPFVLNLVEWMGGSDDLLSLRARTGKPRQIEEVEPPKQKLLAWLNILGVPMLVLFLGVVIWLVRRYQR